MPVGRTSGRRYDLDWLRVGALGLLIVTHVTFVYRTTNWRINSEYAGLWGDEIVAALAPWRMSLVFFIGGVATRFMLAGRDLAGFAVNRVMRLGIPFIVAAVLLVPPMWYLADPLSRGQNYFTYMLQTPMHAHVVYGLHLPDLGHVWFLPYLLTYAMLAALAWWFAPKTWKRIEDGVSGLPLAILAVGLAAMFVLSDAVLKPIFGRTDMLIDDPAGHVRSLPVFALGVLLARADGFWQRLHTARLYLAGCAVVTMMIAIAAARADTLSGHAIAPWVPGAADGIYGAAMLFTILAFAQSFLNHPSPQLRYFSDAIMPVYLLHQPMIVAAGVVLIGAHLPLWVEYPLMIAAALLVPLTIYHVIIRRIDVLRVAFGLKPNGAHAAKNDNVDHGRPA